MSRCCRRVPSALFPHVNLLLAVYAGAGLVTAARLKWDPSAYIVLRQLLPEVYRAATLGLLVGALLLLLLAHLAAAALLTRRTPLRRLLFIMYAVVMVCVVCLEAGWTGWTALRVRAWLRGAGGRDLRAALDVQRHLTPLLAALGRLHPLPNTLHDLLEEVEKDVPVNAYVAAAGAGVLVALQLLAVTLAVSLAYRAPHTRGRTHSLTTVTTTSSLASSGSGRSGRSGGSDGTGRADSEHTPLRTAYRNGRIVVL